MGFRGNFSLIVVKSQFLTAERDDRNSHKVAKTQNWCEFSCVNSKETRFAFYLIKKKSKTTKKNPPCYGVPYFLKIHKFGQKRNTRQGHRYKTTKMIKKGVKNY